MKSWLVFFVLLSGVLSAQCDERNEAPTFQNVPSFISLFNRGLCLSGSISDTIICVEVEPSDVNRIASFSFSSPNGSGVTVNGIKTYDENCTLISEGSEVPATSESFTICYSISANIIDNFCPYLLRVNPLAVEWGNVSCAYESQMATVSWSTLSNKNTHYFELWTSPDGSIWKRVGTLPPKHITSSSESVYSFSYRPAFAGINYVMIREFDLNGSISIAPLCYFNAEFISQPEPSFDLLGRRASDADYFYYIRR